MTCRKRFHFHDEPGWDDARARWLAETAPNETPTDALLRRLEAIREMELIETRALGGGGGIA